MVLKNLIKARRGHADALTDDTQFAASSLLPGFEALSTVVLVLDTRNFRIAYANPSAEQMLEMSHKQLTQMNWPDLFANAEELASTVASIAENRFNATRLDAQLQRPGREQVQVHAIVAYLEAANGYT